MVGRSFRRVSAPGLLGGWLVAVGCNPVPPADAGTSTGVGGTTTGGGESASSTATATATASTDTATTGITPTTGAVSTAGDSTGATDAATSDGGSTTGGTTMALPDPTGWTTDGDDDTTGGFECNWKGSPEAEDFCPLAAAANADISGTTPVGPVAFKFAYFGVLDDCVHCPSAADGTLVFYGEADGPKLGEVDRLTMNFWLETDVSVELAGNKVAFDNFDESIILSFMDVDVPSIAETNPPLDANAPPTLSGTLAIVGGGWNVSGTFTSTLCSVANSMLICE